MIRFADGSERTILNEVFGVNSGGRVLAQRTQLPLDLGTVQRVRSSLCGMTITSISVTLTMLLLSFILFPLYYTVAVSLGYICA